MPEQAPESAKAKVLLVDDEALVRFGTSMMLDELGYEVVEAATGQQALALLHENPDVKLLLSDFRMPDMDGLELLVQAKALVPEIRSVLMTGYDVADPRLDGASAARLGKPFGLEELQLALARAC